MTDIKKIEALTSEVNMWIGKLSHSKLENCQNPWNPNCENSDIELYILYDDERLPVCKSCWEKIVKTDVEW